MRLAKVRITDYRPPGAGGISPLERGAATRGGSMSGLEHLSAIQAREAMEHDRAVRDYLPETVEAAWNDLAGRAVHDRRNPEHRWVMARRAALRRLGVSMRERGIA
jgi:hypothetical protein